MLETKMTNKINIKKVRLWLKSNTTANPSAMELLRAGILSGLFVGAITWIYEVILYAYILHTTGTYEISARGAFLVFGPGVKALGVGVLLVGMSVHFGTAALWAILFAFLWPRLRSWHVEASLAGVVFGLVACVVMGAVVTNFARIAVEPSRVMILFAVIYHTLAFGIPLALTVQNLLRVRLSEATAPPQ